MPIHYYSPVGKCIYCGETKLPPGILRFGDEHIIPFSMGGTLILREASCKRCEKLINRELETPVTSQEWGDLRAKRKFPTRNKLNRKKRTHVAIRAIDGSLMRVPLADHSTPVLLYKFSEARILSGLSRLL